MIENTNRIFLTFYGDFCSIFARVSEVAIFYVKAKPILIKNIFFCVFGYDSDPIKEDISGVENLRKI